VSGRLITLAGARFHRGAETASVGIQITFHRSRTGNGVFVHRQDKDLIRRVRLAKKRLFQAQAQVR
jgi:hypothetical protein